MCLTTHSEGSLQNLPIFQMSPSGETSQSILTEGKKIIDTKR